MAGMNESCEKPIDTAIRALGGVAASVRALGLNGHATIYQWRKTQVPAERCPSIEEATGGAVRCEDLRPDVRWDVLRGKPAPTPSDQVA